MTHTCDMPRGDLKRIDGSHYPPHRCGRPATLKHTRHFLAGPSAIYLCDLHAHMADGCEDVEAIENAVNQEEYA